MDLLYVATSFVPFGLFDVSFELCFCTWLGLEKSFYLKFSLMG